MAEAFPNPFNPSTRIYFALPSEGRVKVEVLDYLGREMATLAQGEYAAGGYSVTWNAKDVATGVYFARITVTGALGKVVYTKTNKLLLTK